MYHMPAPKLYHHRDRVAEDAFGKFEQVLTIIEDMDIVTFKTLWTTTAKKSTRVDILCDILCDWSVE